LVKAGEHNTIVTMKFCVMNDLVFLHFIKNVYLNSYFRSVLIYNMSSLRRWISFPICCLL